MNEKLLTQTLYYLTSGGGVMIPILVISVWMWVLIIKKAILFYKLNREEYSIHEISKAIKKETLLGASWQRDIMSTFLQWRKSTEYLDFSLFLKLKKKQEAEADKYITTILVLAGVAPLLGLLGTVCGMITTFEVISVFGTGEAKAMAGGISEALITTQTGLLVAVPGLALGHFLEKRASNLKGRIHRFCLGLYREMGL